MCNFLFVAAAIGHYECMYFSALTCAALCCVLKVSGYSIRRTKDEIINYICYLNEIQKVSSRIKRTHRTKLQHYSKGKRECACVYEEIHAATTIVNDNHDDTQYMNRIEL